MSPLFRLYIPRPTLIAQLNRAWSITVRLEKKDKWSIDGCQQKPTVQRSVDVIHTQKSGFILEER